MKKNITIEEIIVKKVERKLGKNVLTDFLNEVIFDTLEYHQQDDSDIMNIRKNVLFDLIQQDLLINIQDYNYIKYFNYNYNLILNKLKLNEKNLNNEYNIFSNNSYQNIDNLINKMILEKMLDYLFDIDDILDDIIDLYYFSIKVASGKHFGYNIIDNCYISEKNYQLIDNYILSNYQEQELRRLVIYPDFHGLSLNIDTIKHIPESIYNLLDMFNVIN